MPRSSTALRVTAFVLCPGFYRFSSQPPRRCRVICLPLSPVFDRFCLAIFTNYLLPFALSRLFLYTALDSLFHLPLVFSLLLSHVSIAVVPSPELQNIVFLPWTKVNIFLHTFTIDSAYSFDAVFSLTILRSSRHLHLWHFC